MNIKYFLKITVIVNLYFLLLPINDSYCQRLNNQILKNNKLELNFANPSVIQLLNKNSHMLTTTQLDSMISERYDTTAQEVKTSYQYTEQKKLSKVTVEYFDDDEITSGDSFTFTYSGEKLGTVLTYKLVNLEWIPKEKTDNNYDPNGNNILTTKEKWDKINSVWIGITRTSRTFDFPQKLLSEMTEVWDSASSSWKKFSLVENTYNSDNQKLTNIVKVNVNEIWFNFSKNLYTYGSNGKMSENKSFIWDYTDNIWVDKGIITYTYNENNLEILSLEKELKDGSWINKRKTTKTYISGILLINNLVEDWDNGVWVKNNEMTITYDTEGQIISYSSMNNWNGSNWGEGDKLTFGYNSDNMCDNITHESFFQNHWVSADGIMWPPNLFSYDPEFMSYYFTSGYEAELFYPNATAVENNDIDVPNEIMLEQNYPNPFNPTTTIKYLLPLNSGNKLSNVKLVIYDVLGNEIETLVNEQKSAGIYEVKFDASNLSSGIYFYELKTANFNKVRKMILIK
jgi:hypothetical protein